MTDKYEMLPSISPELRKISDVLADLAKKIEASQVEDGDPPFEISHDEYLLLHHCFTKLGTINYSVKKSAQ